MILRKNGLFLMEQRLPLQIKWNDPQQEKMDLLNSLLFLIRRMKHGYGRIKWYGCVVAK